MKGYYWVKGASEYRCPDKQIGQENEKDDFKKIAISINNPSKQNNNAAKISYGLKPKLLNKIKTNFENEFLKKVNLPKLKVYSYEQKNVFFSRISNKSVLNDDSNKGNPRSSTLSIISFIVFLAAVTISVICIIDLALYLVPVPAGIFGLLFAFVLDLIAVLLAIVALVVHEKLKGLDISVIGINVMVIIYLFLLAYVIR